MFPIYRKYDHNRSFFKIISEEEFIQIDIIGIHYLQTFLKAKAYPELLYIQDMIALKNKHWVASTKEEYESMLSKGTPEK